MPVHWIDAQTLWFPPEGKSESSTQLVDKITWRQYEIRCAYWEPHNKKEAGNRANEFRKKEEIDSIETTTDSDIPLVSRRHTVGKSRGDEQTILMPKPPSAPNISYQIPRRKPPPSESLLHVRSKKRSPSPASSDDEERDPTWCQPLKKAMNNHCITQQHRTPLQDCTSDLNVTVNDCQDQTSAFVPQSELSTHPTTIQGCWTISQQTEVQANIESPATQGVSSLASPRALPAITRTIVTPAFQETSTSVNPHAAVQSSTPSTTAMKDVSVSTPSTPSSVQPRMTTAVHSSTPSTTAMKDVSTGSTPSSVQPSMHTIITTTTLTTAVQV